MFSNVSTCKLVILLGYEKKHCKEIECHGLNVLCSALLH